MLRRGIAVLLACALFWSVPGAPAYAALARTAEQVPARAGSLPLASPQGNLDLPLELSPIPDASLAPPRLSAPDAAASAPSARAVEAAQSPAAEARGASESPGALREMAELGQVPPEALPDSTGRMMEGSSSGFRRGPVELDFSLEDGVAVLGLNEAGHAYAREPRQSPPAARYRPQHSSAIFPTLLTLASGVLLAFVTTLPMILGWTAPSGPAGFAPEPPASHWGRSALWYAAAGLTAATAVLASYAIGEGVQLAYLMLRARQVPEAELYQAVKEELISLGAHPSAISALLGSVHGRGIIRTFRPQRFSWSFGYTLGNTIYLRPELARTRWLLRKKLIHELKHFQDNRVRGPPPMRSWPVRLWSFLASETMGRVAEFGSGGALRKLRIPALERVLRDAQLSLRLGAPYDALILNPSGRAEEGVAAELENPASYAAVSNAQARVAVLDAPGVPAQEQYLARPENRGRFRFITYPRSFSALPAANSDEAKRIGKALESIGEIYRLSLRLRAMGAGGMRLNSPEFNELDRLSVALGVHKRGAMTQGKLDQLISELYFRVARQQLKDTSLVKSLDAIYQGLHCYGTVFLPFDAGDPGLDMVERILRHWQSSDGGSFSVERVDLPEGGHVLVARKDEPRVNLYLRPVGDKRLGSTRTNVFTDPGADQDAILREAGFDDAQIARFRQAGMQVLHVFGTEEMVPEMAQNRMFVSVNRNYAKALRRFADNAGIGVETSREGYQLHLLESVPMHRLPQVWKLGFDGKGMRYAGIDTGMDRRHEDFIDRFDRTQVVSYVNEGPEEDFGEHGSHKMGIAGANGPVYKGVAPKAELWMGKVFAVSGMGAASGHIMAAALDAMKWGADAISLSLGSPGSTDSELAVFFSELSKKKNSRGRHPLVSASEGNAGPFNRTRSAPGAGEYVFSHGAAAKSLDDGIPEVPFYLSWGPTLDRRYDFEVERLLYEDNPLGGDVEAIQGNPDVYAKGIISVKSGYGKPSPSDTPDGKHRGMSGSSMGEPMGAISLLVLQAVLREIRPGTPDYDFFMDNLPFAVHMIRMASDADMGVPIFIQGAGFPNAEAAVQSARETFRGPGWAARALGRGKPAVPAWDWIRRIKELWDLRHKVNDGTQEAKRQALAEFAASAAPSEDEGEQEKSQQRATSAANLAMEKRFKALRAEALPRLLEALKDKETWLIRHYAAFILRGFRAIETAPALLEAALNDADARVRQTAFLALANMPVPKELLPALKDAAQKAAPEKPDVSLYAAYVLAVQGDPSQVQRLVEGTRSPDKRLRYTAVWLQGQIGLSESPEGAQALVERVQDAAERGNIRHLPIASLTELAAEAPAAVTDSAVLGLLRSSGLQKLDLVRTIAKFFQVAARSSELRERMRSESGSLRPAIVDFVNTNKGSINKPGALGELVSLLAEILDIPLNLPTPVSDPSGLGVPGVDPNLGALHLIVERPTGVSRDPDPQLLSFYSAEVQAAAMPVSNSLWINVPEAKATAFTAAVESQGFKVHRSRPKYKQGHQEPASSGSPETFGAAAADGAGVRITVLDEGGDAAHEAIGAGRVKEARNFTQEGSPEDVGREGSGEGTFLMGVAGAVAPGADFAVGKVLGTNGGSDAQAMAGLEWAAGQVKDPLADPQVVLVGFSGPGTASGPLSRLASALMLMNILVVAPPSNDGAAGRVGSPANAALAVTVGAVDKFGRPAPYSAPKEPGGKPFSWMDIGGSIHPLEIVSLLSTRLKEALAKAAKDKGREGEQPLYQLGAGTAVAAAHSAGRLAVLAGRMKAGMGRLPDGYALWLARLVQAHAARIPGRDEPRMDMAGAAAALDEALKDPKKLAAESEALVREARKAHAAQAAPPPAGPRWLQFLGRFFGLFPS